MNDQDMRKIAENTKSLVIMTYNDAIRSAQSISKNAKEHTELLDQISDKLDPDQVTLGVQIGMAIMERVMEDHRNKYELSANEKIEELLSEDNHGEEKET